MGDKASGTTVVRLEPVLSPAPLWAAFGWLETSIRNNAKYVDLTAWATTNYDKAIVIRRERMAIEEVKALLDEVGAKG